MALNALVNDTPTKSRTFAPAEVVPGLVRAQACVAVGCGVAARPAEFIELSQGCGEQQASSNGHLHGSVRSVSLSARCTGLGGCWPHVVGSRAAGHGL